MSVWTLPMVLTPPSSSPFNSRHSALHCSHQLSFDPVSRPSIWSRVPPTCPLHCDPPLGEALTVSASRGTPGGAFYVTRILLDSVEVSELESGLAIEPGYVDFREN